ncbi:DUF1853 family protein [Vibrio sp. SM6]|uniref:DUF1853 family protein n=1 Tax=Vibrio agarilyticus TaxID=2726741 RepID=A0A7X8TMP7_9VIBR|nr:DUF1853 family protein [Vibrio agarilyticus]NLS11583.1 DUF1853 family protein [Vibrio agarilyticus]
MSSLMQFAHWITGNPSLVKEDGIFCSPHTLGLSAPPSLPTYQGNPRLGFVYQSLISSLLQNTPRYTRVAEELQLNDQHGRTVGAIDFLLRDNDSQQIEHWEVAIKFYLLHQNRWYGPNAKDRLDKKIDHMVNRQLTLTQSPEFIAQFKDIEPHAHHAIIQGRLYVNPFEPAPIPSQCAGFELNANQSIGYWCFEHQLSQLVEPIYPLEKLDWATGKAPFHRAIQNAHHRFIHGISPTGRFWFVVPDSWPDTSQNK